MNLESEEEKTNWLTQNEYTQDEVNEAINRIDTLFEETKAQKELVAGYMQEYAAQQQAKIDAEEARRAAAEEENKAREAEAQEQRAKEMQRDIDNI
jgi:hypothetical protein